MSSEESFSKESFREYIGNQFDNYFTQSLPVDSIKEFPFTYKYIFGSATFACMIAGFLYFTVSGFDSQRNAKFISITDDAGICDPVLKAVQGTYLASTAGIWEGEVGFHYNQALFSFYFFNLFISTPDYESGMRYVQYQMLDYFGNYSSSFNLAMNVLVLTSYQLVLTVGDSRMASSNATCFIDSDNFFDSVTGQMTVTYDYSQYAVACEANFNPNFFGYVTTSPTLSVNMDTRSLVTALSVNMGIPGARLLLEDVPLSQMVLDSYEFEIEVNGMIFEVAQYYTVRYPGMYPFICLESVNSDVFSEGHPLCLVAVGTVYGIPLLNHMGASSEEPIYCNCSTSAGTAIYCNAFTLMFGVIANANYTQELIGLEKFNTLIPLIPLIELAQRYSANYGNSWTEGMFHLNEDAYLAQYSTVMHNMSYQGADRSFDFCGFDCTIITVLSDDYFNQGVSSNYYQLYNGSCNSNAFNMSNWDKLVSTPPANLTENYYSCKPTALGALFISIGVSQGNVSFLLIFLTLVMMPVSFLILSAYDSVPVKEEYSEDERAFAQKEFLNLLLKARDGTIDNGIDGRTSIITKIADEMVAAAANRSKIEKKKSGLGETKKGPPPLRRQKSFAIRKKSTHTELIMLSSSKADTPSTLEENPLRSRSMMSDNERL